MQQTNTPVSKVKVAAKWLVLIGFLILVVSVCFLGPTSRRPVPDASDGSDIARLAIFLVIAGFFLCLGIGGYFLVLATTCFTFNFSTPFWNGLKGKLFVANILVLIQIVVGVALAVSAFITPMLESRGLSHEAAFALPVVASIVPLQLLQVWILIWAPLERKAIQKRLAALGIAPQQMESDVLVGISNPASGRLKRFAGIEEDVGALWVGPEQLIYWGDLERFSITRDQLVQMERKADTRSTTMLAGVAHIILHVRTSDGGERQLRLHTEGVNTMGGKRKAMDKLAEAILRWHEAAPTAPA